MNSSKTIWVLLFLSSVLTVSGLMMLLDAHDTPHRLSGLTALVFFALCDFALASTLWSRRQNRMHAADLQVTIVPGVRLPMKRGKILSMGTVLICLGALGALTAYGEKDWIIVSIGAGAALVGLTLFLMLAFGLLGHDYLLFEPEGLRIGNKKGSILFEWGNIGRIMPTEFQNNQVIYLMARDQQALALTATGSGQWTPQRILVQTGKIRKWYGSDWMFMTSHYGLNAALLARAIATYVTDPEVRSGLERHLELENKKA